jgi:Tfp pilus assembly protein PilN
MRPVNLIPPEDRRGDHAPLRAGVASYAIVGALALALVGVVLVVLTSNQISDSKAEIASLQARKTQADLTAQNLAPYANFASLEDARTATVSTLAQSRFDWERVLKELALVIPPDVTLENLTGKASAESSVGEAGTTSSTSDASVTGPSLVIQGCALGQEGTAAFLAALKDIDGVTRVGMQSSQLPDEETTSAATGDSASTVTDSDSCQTRPSIARFEITVAFDAVPLPQTAAAPATGTPAAAPAPGTTTPTTTTAAPTTTTSTTPTATDAAATPSEQQSAVDSANKQVSDAKQEAASVGVGGG